MSRRRSPLGRCCAFAVFAVSFAGVACHAPTRGTPPPAADVDFPRCVGSDAAGNAVACRAPQRTYDGDACVCADGHGHAFYGRVQERPR